MTELEVKDICHEYHIKNWTLNDDGKVDVDGYVNLYGIGLTNIPLLFGRVSGDFLCHGIKGSVGVSLTSLEGCPSYVGGNFYCSYNDLYTLYGAPTHVGGDFWCMGNKLTNFIGCPNSIRGSMYFLSNNILDFEGFPKLVVGDIHILENPVTPIWELFENRDDIEFFNDCDPIRGNSIVLNRLNYFLEEVGKKPVSGISGYRTTY